MQAEIAPEIRATAVNWRVRHIVSDIVAPYIGMALGAALVWACIKWVRLHHLIFTLIYLFGAAVFSIGGFFVAWPLLNHFKVSHHYAFVPMLIGVIVWTVPYLYRALQRISLFRSQTARQ